MSNLHLKAEEELNRYIAQHGTHPTTVVMNWPTYHKIRDELRSLMETPFSGELIEFHGSKIRIDPFIGDDITFFLTE